MAASICEDGQPGQNHRSETDAKDSKGSRKPKFHEFYGVEGIEDPEDYRENGLHPVDILDILDGRFEVVHKLGSGGIATVWLCYEEARSRWKAIKINAALHSSPDSAELKISKIFEEQGVAHQQLEENHIITVEETFWIEGPNGKHLCSVLPVVGPSLQHWREMAIELDAATINKVCHEITEGLHFLHNHGICHGEFRPQNILMRLVDGGLDHLDPDDLFSRISLHDRHKVETLSGEKCPNAPRYVVEPLNWYELKDLLTDSVSIVDFGEAFEATSPPDFLGIPGTYASPEVAYGGEPFGKAVDIWSLAVTILELRTGRELGNDSNSPLNRMEIFAGPMPHPYRTAAAEEIYQNQLYEYDRYGPDEMEKPQPPIEDMLNGPLSLTELEWRASGGEGESKVSFGGGIEELLRGECWEQVFIPEEEKVEGEEATVKMVPCHIPEHEVVMLTGLLSGMMKYKPRERPSTSDILSHPWFNIALRNENPDTPEPVEALQGFTREGVSPRSEEVDTSKSKKNIHDDVTATTESHWSRRLSSSLQSQMFIRLSLLMPIVASLVLLWYIRLCSERVSIGKIEVFNVVVAPVPHSSGSN
ncbi:hypothetical protein NPX13_g7913 [Xylaria arbuscula]|uniref:non-specific serine/threonine protein kinase n=1 Tax=Xylaria arbuscula TaxID=114810 RepID=A0A9W8N9Q5_9PEZI|nr:hypothetical protein NPX13_g7913 [Xylaria arbuscula]